MAEAVVRTGLVAAVVLVLAIACSDGSGGAAPAAGKSGSTRGEADPPDAPPFAPTAPGDADDPSDEWSAHIVEPCDAEPVVLSSDAGVEFVRTPEACFHDLPGFSFDARFVEIEGLRQGYVEAGPADGPTVVLLHGQPTWSYLYRHMIPILADAGLRVIAMDHLGMGRSDKPIDIDAYSYLGHADRLTGFLDGIGARDVNLFVQDWGSLIGLRTAGLDPDRFATIALGNGTLPRAPAGVETYASVVDPQVPQNLVAPYANIPAQQPDFYDGCERRVQTTNDFARWMEYAMTARSFKPSETVEALTWNNLPDHEVAGYDAPFPSGVYMAGVRAMPSLIRQVPGETEDAWRGLESFDRPFLTLWGANDLGRQGSCETQQQFIDSVPGAAAQPHARLEEAGHFLQEDRGVDLAEQLVAWYRQNGIIAGVPAEAAAELGRDETAAETRRYCEILLVYPTDAAPRVEVWGTQGLNLCPMARWEALDPARIRADTGAASVVLNGPRFALMDQASGSILQSDKRRVFGDLEMRFLTTVVAPSSEARPYRTITVLRSTTYRYFAGRSVFELVSPDGAVYVMQAASQIVDRNLVPADLPTLGERLAVPDGWSYRVRVLTDDLELTTDGEATIVQDEFANTYQLAPSVALS